MIGDVAGGHGAFQFALAGLVPAALEQPGPQRHELRLRKCAPHAGQQAVIGPAGIVNRLPVGDQRPAQAAQFDQPAPVTAAAGQARRLQHQHRAHVPCRHTGHQPLETMAIPCRGRRMALVSVQDHDGFRRPAQGPGPVGQIVLALRALPVAGHLEHRRLAHIDMGLAALVVQRDLGVGGRARHHRATSKRGLGTDGAYHQGTDQSDKGFGVFEFAGASRLIRCRARSSKAWGDSLGARGKAGEANGGRSVSRHGTGRLRPSRVRRRIHGSSPRQ